MLDIVLFITAFLGNTLILVALHKETSLHPPSKLLYRSLATTDLCVGIIVEPLAFVFLLSVINERWNICRHAFDAAFATACTLCLVSLLTLTAIAVDRLLALLLQTQLQTSCNVKADLSNYNWFLGCVHCRHSNAFLELPYNQMVWLHSYITVFSHLNCLLYQNFPHFSSSSTPITRQHSTRTSEPGNSNEFSTIQEGRVQRNVGAVDVSSLLSTICYNGGLDDSKRALLIHSSCFVYSNSGFSLLKLIIKPGAVLLEDDRSKTGS